MSVLPIRRRTLAIAVPAVVLGAVAAAFVLLLLVQGDLAHAVRHVLRTMGRMGVPGSFLGLYLEESGVPLPISGDVFVVYLGHQYAASIPRLVLVFDDAVSDAIARPQLLLVIERIHRADRFFEKRGRRRRGRSKCRTVCLGRSRSATAA